MDSRERGAIFRQSLYDFPCPVTLGKNAPSFGLHRFKQVLNFIPPDDEGFILRGDKQRLIYKGRRRSHRFTILGDTAFEYDCILLKEPDTNTVTLRMEGAENFDFFRQPDFVPDKFLKGSYAVYKKETLIGEGTGKLCHIHRPEIIDARGRRCWGELAVVGNELRITIPEWFLSGANYPVVVDPTIGTTTVGSLTKVPNPLEPDYDNTYIEGGYAVNKYLVPQNGGGICTAYVYCYSDETSSYATPILYNNVNNKPYWKISKNENEIDVCVAPPWYYEGWKNNSFTLSGNITAGDYVWFGLFSSWFTTRFDYGGECYMGQFNYDLYGDEYDGEPAPYMQLGGYDVYCTIKWSWYFNYTAVNNQNYIRTITQGVTLTDKKLLSAGYKRKTEQTVHPETTTNKLHTVYRRIQEVINCNEYLLFSILIVRRVCEAVKFYDTLKRLRIILIGLLESVNAYDKSKSGYILLIKITDTVRAAGVVLRSLFLFVRIITDVFIGDYLIKRFLVSKTEVKLKSCVTREIILESRIN